MVTINHLSVDQPTREAGLTRKPARAVAWIATAALLALALRGDVEASGLPAAHRVRHGTTPDAHLPAPRLGARAATVLRWPGSRITYYNGATRWNRTIDDAAAMWNRASIGIRLQRVRRLRHAQVRVREVRSLGADIAGDAQLGYGPGIQASLRIGEDFSADWALTTALHEWGHILGLTHRHGVCAVMVPGEATECPTVGPAPWLYPCRRLQVDDVRRAAAIYGGRGRVSRQFCAFQPAFSGDYNASGDDLVIETGPEMTGLATQAGPSCGQGALQQIAAASATVPLPPGRGCVTFWGLYPGGHRSKAATYLYERTARPPIETPPPYLPPPYIPPPSTGPPPRPLDEGFEAPLDGRWVSDPPARWQLTDEAAHGGSLSVSESPYAPYPDDSDTTLTLAHPLDLGARSDCSLVWYARYATEPGYDYLALELRRGPADEWTPAGPLITGTSNGQFEVFIASLAAYEGSPSAELRVHFTSDESVTDDGVDIDDLYVHCNA